MKRNLDVGLKVGVLGWVLIACGSDSGQVADEEFQPKATRPAYPLGKGPLVLVDAAHHNFHTADGRYKPFADLLRSDGYVVQSSQGRFDAETLGAGRILVISNALSERNVDDWSLPTYPAFEAPEIEAVREWVQEGGALLLIADHMPMPGAAAELAAAFGVEFHNGYAITEGLESPRPPMIFSREKGTLAQHPITSGRGPEERIDSVATFTGQAFQAKGDFRPLFIFGPNTQLLLPDVPAQFSDDTPRIPIEGWYQGLTLRLGKGRVAIFGEAAMFSAQSSGRNRRPMGMNSPHAQQNAQFVLNLMHWLSGLLDAQVTQDPTQR